MKPFKSLLPILCLCTTTSLALGVAFPSVCLAQDAPATVAGAIADAARPKSDTERDALRKPSATLSFAGIKPGTLIAELLPGPGYYTRLLSAATGPSGHLWTLAPPPGADGKDHSAPVKAIAADAHYGNVTVLPILLASPTLDLPQSVDVVWTSNNYHDLVNILGSEGMKAFDKLVYQALKPGGVFLVIDHAAAPGSGESETNTLHRIDEKSVIGEVESVGFKLSASSDALKNPADPHTAKVFDPSIRGHTDQFILKFTK